MEAGLRGAEPAGKDRTHEQRERQAGIMTLTSLIALVTWLAMSAIAIAAFVYGTALGYRRAVEDRREGRPAPRGVLMGSAVSGLPSQRHDHLLRARPSGW
jgi:hypothetical protein